jgi:hypothetical protein
MEYDSQNLLADDETWTAILEPDLCRNSVAVETLARLLFEIKKAISSGPEGIIQASNTLQNGIEQIYLHTDEHKAALKLFLVSLDGNLKPQDEPLRLVNAALARAVGQARQPHRKP